MIMTIDLTYPIHAAMFKYPKDTELLVEADQAHISEEGKIQSAFTTYWLKNHYGTHVDAPAHKLPKGNRIDAYKPEKFINDALLIDLTDKKIMHRLHNRGITPDDIAGKIDFERINREDIGALLFYTGYSDQMEKYEGNIFGSSKHDFENSFPYFLPEAAVSIAKGAPCLNVVGIDSFSVDPPGSSKSHLVFLTKDILVLETLVNLGELARKIKDSSFRLNCVPMAYQHADAAQSRAYAEFRNRVK